MARLSRFPRTPTFKTPTGLSNINVAGAGMTSQQIDDLLQSLVDGGATDGTANISGNDSPSSVGMAYATILLSRSWAITCDCALITQQPSFVVNDEDGTWSSSIVTVGSGVTYQWQFATYAGSSGPPIVWNDYEGDDATTATIANAPAGLYRCNAMRGATTVNSATVVMDVAAIENFVRTDGNAGYGQDDLFLNFGSVTTETSSLWSSLTPPVYAPMGSTYVLKCGGTTVASGTITADGELSYRATGPTGDDAGTYILTITTPAGAVTAGTVTGDGYASGIWTVGDPVIVTQPTYNSETGAAEGLVAAGAEPLTYQWYYGTSGDTAESVDGETNPTLENIPLIVPPFDFWCRVTNDNGTVDTATVSVPH